LFCLSYYFFWSVSLGVLGSLLLSQTVVGELCFLGGDMFGVDDLLLKWLMTFLVGFLCLTIFFSDQKAQI